METLESLEAKGDLLFGPLVPPWFDGDCSTGRFLGKLLKRDLARQACRNHDWCYLLIPILYHAGAPAWQLALHTADAQLRWNLTRVRGGWRGRIWGWIYYRGVRLPFVGGRRAINPYPAMHPRRPKNGGQLLELIECARRFNGGDLTEKSKRVFELLNRQIDIDWVTPRS